MSQKDKLYQALFKAWRECYPELKGNKVQTNVNEYWNKNKSQEEVVRSKILNLKGQALKRQGSVLNFFGQASGNGNQTPAKNLDISGPLKAKEPAPVVPAEKQVQSTSRPSRAQEQVQMEITTLDSQIMALTSMKASGLATNEQLCELKKLSKNKMKSHKKLKILQSDALRQKKLRDLRKKNLEELKKVDPDAFQKLRSVIPSRLPGSGRPRLEEAQPDLLKAIVDLVMPVSSAHDRRRMETLRSCMTLDSLHTALSIEGFKLSRSAVYLRVLPRNQATTEGKTHVITVPVKLLKSKNDLRKDHADTHFCAGTIRFLKDLSEFMGSKSCFILSQDNKATVPLGLTAATKQAPILMHMQYKIKLPDHDYVIASKHKLVPSVYAGITFDRASRKLTYSGPTYIAIRSAKHSISNAKTHAFDFRRLIMLENFKECCKDSNGSVKPIVIVFTDGGPDENPRFRKVLIENARHFKNHNLDAIFVATHAPGQSAYNQVERRMAPLSRDLSGVILPHEHYGSHLDASGNTIDLELEKKNFAKAGECLAEIWNEKIIDGFNVTAKFIEPLDDENPSAESNWEPSEDWIANHIQQSQYMLQITKCFNLNCCSPPRTNLFATILQNRFLPAPILIEESEEGPKMAVPIGTDGHFGSLQSRLLIQKLALDKNSSIPIPYDAYCPSIQQEIQDRVCPICHKYFPGKGLKESHRKQVHRSSMESIIESIEAVVQRSRDDVHDSAMPIIDNLQQWTLSPFADFD